MNCLYNNKQDDQGTLSFIVSGQVCFFPFLMLQSLAGCSELLCSELVKSSHEHQAQWLC